MQTAALPLRKLYPIHLIFLTDLKQECQDSPKWLT